MKIIAPIAAAAALVLIAGCGGSSDGDSGADGAGGTAYSSPEGVIKAINGALPTPPCKHWEQAELAGATTSADCADPTTIGTVAVFASTSSRDDTVEMMRANDDTGSPMFVGKNWFYKGPDADKLSDKLSGKVIESEFDVQ